MATNRLPSPPANESRKRKLTQEDDADGVDPNQDDNDQRAASLSGANTSHVQVGVCRSALAFASAKRPRLSHNPTIASHPGSRSEPGPSANASCNGWPPTTSSPIWYYDQLLMSPSSSPSSNPLPITSGLSYTVEPASNFPRITSSVHLPSLHPPINCGTLKDLDVVSVVIQNPQIRHDLVLEPDLHFRRRRMPPYSQLHETVNNVDNRYWDSVLKEVSTGCTCVTFAGASGLPHSSCRCVCGILPLPGLSHSGNDTTSQPLLVARFSDGVISIRTPRRLRPLLQDLLDVILMVIQPFARSSQIYRQCYRAAADDTDLDVDSAIHDQLAAHASLAALVQTELDPELIERQMDHGLFNPSGLFLMLGDILKRHCAPLRDASITKFVEKATVGSDNGKPSSTADILAALRMCLEVLESMQMDIANHQLRTLRPMLENSAAQFERLAFQSRWIIHDDKNDSENHPSGGSQGGKPSMKRTKMWLLAAKCKLERRQPCSSGSKEFETPLFSPPFSNTPTLFRSLTYGRQIFVSVIQGFVDLIFDPPSFSQSFLPTSHHSSPPHTPHFPLSSATTVTSPTNNHPIPLPGFPETTFLDSSRLAQLADSTMDITTLHLYLLLYRQLVFLRRPTRSTARHLQILTPGGYANRSEEDPRASTGISALKRDILRMTSNRPSLSISADGPLPHSSLSNDTQAENDACPTQSEIVRHIVRHAVRERRRRQCEALEKEGSMVPPLSSSSSPLASMRGVDPMGDPDLTEDADLLSLAQTWASSNLCRDSSLFIMVKERLASLVFQGTTACAFTVTTPGSGGGFSQQQHSKTSSSSHRDDHFDDTGNSNASSLLARSKSLFLFHSEEIHTLIQRTMAMTLHHVNTYLDIYERPDFLASL